MQASFVECQRRQGAYIRFIASFCLNRVVIEARTRTISRIFHRERSRPISTRSWYGHPFTPTIPQHLICAMSAKSSPYKNTGGLACAVIPIIVHDRLQCAPVSRAHYLGCYPNPRWSRARGPSKAHVSCLLPELPSLLTSQIPLPQHSYLSRSYALKKIPRGVNST